MTAPTLTEFLLARIADDEERARFVDSQHDEWARRQRWEPWRLSWQDEYDLLCIDPARAIAECEAKRRIVELHPLKRFVPTPNTWDARDICPTCHGHGYPCDTLRHLASVYADHPNYDEAWRP